MQDFDIRWKQRFDNYNKALTKLKEAVSIISRELHYGSEVDELLQEGLIQRFEYTHELAWNVMKDMPNIKAILTSVGQGMPSERLCRLTLSATGHG